MIYVKELHINQNVAIFVTRRVQIKNTINNMQADDCIVYSPLYLHNMLDMFMFFALNYNDLILILRNFYICV